MVAWTDREPRNYYSEMLNRRDNRAFGDGSTEAELMTGEPDDLDTAVLDWNDLQDDLEERGVPASKIAIPF